MGTLCGLRNTNKCYSVFTLISMKRALISNCCIIFYDDSAVITLLTGTSFFAAYVYFYQKYFLKSQTDNSSTFKTIFKTVVIENSFQFYPYTNVFQQHCILSTFSEFQLQSISKAKCKLTPVDHPGMSSDQLNMGRGSQWLRYEC